MLRLVAPGQARTKWAFCAGRERDFFADVIRAAWFIGTGMGGSPSMTSVGTSGRWSSTFVVIGLSTTWRSIHTWRGRQGTSVLGLEEAVYVTIHVCPLRCTRAAHAGIQQKNMSAQVVNTLMGTAHARKLIAA